jgi:hypothetical protein
MRYARLGVMLALSATPAFAQPSPEAPPDEPAPAEHSEPEPRDLPPEPAPSPTPEVGKDLVKDPVKQPVSWGAQPPEPHPDRGFRFGSYGRVLAGSDLRGGKPERVRVTAVSPRIIEPSYLELEFSYGFDQVRTMKSEIVIRPIITLAFDGTLFHETGEFDAQPALRNMFVDGRIGRDWSLWVGSRMYRGDDIYLFDYWPLDDINTVGGGIQYRPHVHFLRAGPPDQLELGAHVGFNRLLNDFQFQETEVANPVQGATIVEQLNRQRTIASASAAYVATASDGGIGGKLKVHGEYHSLPSGTRKRADGTFEALPSDTGYLIGAQLGTFGFSDDKRFRRHANLFVRYAKGLAAFDELAPPTSFGLGLETDRANELTFGLSANWDHDYGNLMVGALSRRFIDADQNAIDPDDGWEYAIDARPLVRVIPDWFVGADISYQARFPRGLNPITLRAEDPAIFQIAPMIAWSPMGPSGYDRPQIRLVYRAAYLNEGARNLYVPDDPRHDDSVVHFLGVQAEWWFNSSTYR